MTVIPAADDWDDLPKALALLAKHKTGKFPFHCEHDTLYVFSDYTKYTPEELRQLDEWGFFPNEDTEGFMSFRYGCA